MKIEDIIDVLDLLELDYDITEETTNTDYLTVFINTGDYQEILKKIYFNINNGYIISNYEKKKEIKKQIKKLQKELKNLE